MWNRGDGKGLCHRWQINRDGSIRAGANTEVGLCMKNEGDMNGRGVQLFKGGTSPPDDFHKWIIKRATGTQFYTIRSAVDGAFGLCTKPDGENDGAEPQIWDCGPNEESDEFHRWIIEPCEE